jgi:hypothetical protein
MDAPPKSRRAAVVDCWEPVRVWVAQFSQTEQDKPSPVVSRFARLMKYRAVSSEQQDALDKAFKLLSSAANTSDDLLALFSGLPDSADAQPLTRLSFGRRSEPLAVQRDRYVALASHADALLKFLKSEPPAMSLRQLLADVAMEDGYDGSGGDSDTAVLRRQNAKQAQVLRDAGADAGLVGALQWLSHALKGADPHRWHLTGQPLAADAARQTYVRLVAGLNRYLKKPKHAALTVLANANYSRVVLTADELRKTWNSADGRLRATGKTD